MSSVRCGLGGVAVQAADTGTIVPFGAGDRASAAKLPAWDWGSGYNRYLDSPGLCDPKSEQRSIFIDYDWLQTLTSEFAYPAFRMMVIADDHEDLSRVGSNRYLAAQLDFPQEPVRVARIFRRSRDRRRSQWLSQASCATSKPSSRGSTAQVQQRESQRYP